MKTKEIVNRNNRRRLCNNLHVDDLSNAWYFKRLSVRINKLINQCGYTSEKKSLNYPETRTLMRNPYDEGKRCIEKESKIKFEEYKNCC